MSEWRDEINRKALARLDRALPAVFPRPALIHALARRFTPPMPRLDRFLLAGPSAAGRPPRPRPCRAPRRPPPVGVAARPRDSGPRENGRPQRGPGLAP